MKLYNGILEKIALPLGDALLRTEYIHRLNTWRRVQYLSEEELHDLHRKKLSAVLAHAATNIPYYRHLVGSTSNPSIGDFPILTKRELRTDLDRLLWHPDRRAELVCEKSSGSSGVQGEVFMSRRERSNVQAIQTLLWEWSGYRIGSPMLQTGMTLKRGISKSIKDVLFRTQYRSAFGLDEGETSEILRYLARHPVRFLGGYASSLYVYAQVARKFDIRNVHFDSAISWGDKMFPHYRELIQQQFGARVFDTYGATEGFMIAGQKDLDYYYILTPHVHLELVDGDGKEVADGEIGQVVLTSLDAFEMPLIRYRIGDLAVRLPRSEYPEKRDLNLPLLQKIIGRDTDIVRTRSGKSMIVHFFTAIFEHVPEISQFRVVQNKDYSVTIEYIKGANFAGEILSGIDGKIQDHLGERFDVTFTEVESIPATPSGKPQIILSYLNS